MFLRPNPRAQRAYHCSNLAISKRSTLVCVLVCPTILPAFDRRSRLEPRARPHLPPLLPSVLLFVSRLSVCVCVPELWFRLGLCGPVVARGGERRGQGRRHQRQHTLRRHSAHTQAEKRGARRGEGARSRQAADARRGAHSSSGRSQKPPAHPKRHSDTTQRRTLARIGVARFGSSQAVTRTRSDLCCLPVCARCSAASSPHPHKRSHRPKPSRLLRCLLVALCVFSPFCCLSCVPPCCLREWFPPFAARLPRRAIALPLVRPMRALSKSSVVPMMGGTCLDATGDTTATALTESWDANVTATSPLSSFAYSRSHS